MADDKTTLRDGFDQPHDIPEVIAAFPANIGKYMPAWSNIPQNFRDHYGDAESAPWIRFQSDWFFKGTSRATLKPRPDVDSDKAWRHLAVIQGSFDPKHEHKQAAVAWLASRWFEAVNA